MSEKRKPPLFDVAPIGVCSRLSRGAPCGDEAFLHVLWDFETLENGAVCTGHAAELDTTWEYAQAHEYEDGVCGQPGSLWHVDTNRCSLPEPAPSVDATTRVALPA